MRRRVEAERSLVLDTEEETGVGATTSGQEGVLFANKITSMLL